MQAQLQDHLVRMRAGVPVMPLLPGQAKAQAVRLRSAGLPYTSIAQVMAVYHGVVKSPNAWNWVVRKSGAPPKHHPNGATRVSPPQRRAARP